MPDRNTAQRELMKLAVYYPQTRLSQAEIDVLCTLWMEDLAEIGDADFIAAVAAVRRTSRFFPTPAEVRNAAALAAEEASRRRAVLCTPQPETVDRARMHALAKAMRPALAGDPDAKALYAHLAAGLSADIASRYYSDK